MKKRILMITLSLLLILSLAACADTDVVGSESVTSFDKVLGAMENNVAEDEMNGGWALTSPDGSERFIWSKDYSAGTPHDLMLEFDAQPFIDAGLDVTKLPAGILIEDKIMVGSNLGDEELTYDGDPTPIASYEKIVELYRERVKYHTDLDHYGVNVGDGNMFEWAKDMGTNDKDIVFVVDPKMFTDAGVDPTKVEGWIFAKVKVDDEDGKPIEVDKFLKPFEIQ
ncbi:MAG TPA: hypothetical protein VEA58_13225 [Anaerovoracaceae bacterium]|nr:hypothetical protein [Anaerovoracaceae bacterium]